MLGEGGEKLWEHQEKWLVEEREKSKSKVGGN